MDSYGYVWTRMGPYGPWGLPGGFLGPPGGLGEPKRRVSGFWGCGWVHPLGPIACLGPISLLRLLCPCYKALQARYVPMCLEAC